MQQTKSDQPIVSANDSFRDMMASIVSDQQEQLLSSLSRQISNLVDTAIETRISGLNLNPQQMSETSQDNQSSTQNNPRSPPQMHT